MLIRFYLLFSADAYYFDLTVGHTERKKNLFATNNNGIKQEKQKNNTEVSSYQAARKAKSRLCWPPTLLILLH